MIRLGENYASSCNPHESSYPISPHYHMPFPQLGLGYLAAILEQNNYEVDVIDCQALNIHYEEFRQEISKHQPDVVGFTVLPSHTNLHCTLQK